MTRVAEGQLVPFTDGTRMMHRVVLQLDIMRVLVQEVMTGFESWSLPHPPEQDVTTLGQVTQGHLLKCPLSDIEEIPRGSPLMTAIPP